MKLTDFGQTMRKYRMRHGMNQKSLGRLLGVKANHISLLENGRRDPSPSVQRKMEQLLLQDEWGKALLQESKMISDEDMELMMSLYRKLCRIHPSNRHSCIDLISYILDVMSRTL